MDFPVRYVKYPEANSDSDVDFSLFWINKNKLLELGNSVVGKTWNLHPVGLVFKTMVGGSFVIFPVRWNNKVFWFHILINNDVFCWLQLNNPDFVVSCSSHAFSYRNSIGCVDHLLVKILRRPTGCGSKSFVVTKRSKFHLAKKETCFAINPQSEMI